MFFDLISQCVLCGRLAETGLCPHCHLELESHCTLSGPLCRCALPGPGLDPGALCGRCLDRPPLFTASYCAWVYGFPLDRLLNAYKHRGKLTVERALETLMRAQPLPWPQADLICPLPAHWRRHWWRGFDQAERLAMILGRRWQRPVVPVLTRARATRHQQGQGRAERVRNLRHAFRADERARGRRVLLVDDVMTTGASARAAARALNEAGAEEVRVWALARALDAGRRTPDAITRRGEVRRAD